MEKTIDEILIENGITELTGKEHDGIIVAFKQYAKQESDHKVKIAIENLTSKCTRVEVIDEKGRSYVNWKESNKVEISMQDNNRTMKVFISK